MEDFNMSHIYANDIIPLETIGETSYVFYDSDTSCTYINDIHKNIEINLPPIIENQLSNSTMTEPDSTSPSDLEPAAPPSDLEPAALPSDLEQDKQISCSLVKLTNIVNEQTIKGYNKGYTAGYNIGYNSGYNDASILINIPSVGIGISIGLMLSGLIVYLRK